MRAIETCLFCQASSFETIVSRQDRLTNSSLKFAYIQCQQCGWISLTPQPSMTELAEFYPPHYESFLTNDTLDSLPRHLINENERKYQLIAQHHPTPGFVLDVGCATGHFLHCMQRHQWKVWGVEPAISASHQAHRNYNLPIIAGDLSATHFPANMFDVITMWDVFEHLDNVQPVLQEISRILKEDGLLLFTIPNLFSFDAAIFRQYWIGWDAPRHLHLCSLATVTTLLQQTGFKLLKTQCLGGEYGAFVLSLQTRLHDRTSLNQANKLSRQLGMLMLRTSLLPYFWLSRKLKRSTIITIVAMKDTKI